MTNQSLKFMCYLSTLHEINKINLYFLKEKNLKQKNLFLLICLFQFFYLHNMFKYRIKYNSTLTTNTRLLTYIHKYQSRVSLLSPDTQTHIRIRIYMHNDHLCQSMASRNCIGFSKIKSTKTVKPFENDCWTSRAPSRTCITLETKHIKASIG